MVTPTEARTLLLEAHAASRAAHAPRLVPELLRELRTIPRNEWAGFLFLCVAAVVIVVGGLAGGR